MARSSGMVATTTPPAFITAKRAATIIGLLGARSSTRLPGTRPSRATSTLAMRLTRSASCGIGQRLVRRAKAGALALARVDPAVERAR